jgi:hypothetical protein
LRKSAKTTLDGEQLRGFNKWFSTVETSGQLATLFKPFQKPPSLLNPAI